MAFTTKNYRHVAVGWWRTRTAVPIPLSVVHSVKCLFTYLLWKFLITCNSILLRYMYRYGRPIVPNAVCNQSREDEHSKGLPGNV